MKLFYIFKMLVELKPQTGISYYYSGGEICNINHLHNFESMILAKLT